MKQGLLPAFRDHCLQGMASSSCASAPPWRVTFSSTSALPRRCRGAGRWLPPARQPHSANYPTAFPGLDSVQAGFLNYHHLQYLSNGNDSLFKCRKVIRQHFQAFKSRFLSNLGIDARIGLGAEHSFPVAQTVQSRETACRAAEGGEVPLGRPCTLIPEITVS